MTRWLLLAALALPGCPVVPTPPDPGPAPVGDCRAAGERLRALGCPEARTPEGTPFSEACERAQRDGRDWCPSAISQVSDCSEVEDASRRCEP